MPDLCSNTILLNFEINFVQFPAEGCTLKTASEATIFNFQLSIFNSDSKNRLASQERRLSSPGSFFPPA